jgi:hypothetical protein
MAAAARPSLSLFQRASARASRARCFYAGFGVALCTNVPSGAVWWGLYGATRGHFYDLAARWNRAKHNNQSPHSPHANGAGAATGGFGITSTTDNPVVNAAAGCVASIVTALLFNPLHVVRTRQQALPGDDGRPQRARAVLRTLLRSNGGLRNLYKGAGTAAALAALEGTIQSSVYEYTRWLNDRSRK